MCGGRLPPARHGGVDCRGVGGVELRESTPDRTKGEDLNHRMRFALASMLAPLSGPAIQARVALGGRPHVRILLYHAVPSDSLQHFERQVDAVCAHHRVITPDEFHRFMDGTANLPARSVLFSFDDGCRSSWQAVEQVLSPRGIRVLFFVVSGFIDVATGDWRGWASRQLFHGRVPPAGLADSYAPMSWDELAALVAAGHTVGSHTVTHASLATLQGEPLHREIVESGDRLEQQLGVRVEDFAFPFGNIASVSPEALRLAGRRYRFCYSGLRGGNDRDQPRLAILRESAAATDPPAYVSIMLDGLLAWPHGASASRLRRMAAGCG